MVFKRIFPVSSNDPRYKKKSTRNLKRDIEKIKKKATRLFRDELFKPESAEE